MDEGLRCGVDFCRLREGGGLFFGPEIFGFTDDLEVEVGGFAGLEVFGLELFGIHFLFADDDAVSRDFAGVGEVVAEFFIRKDDGGGVAVFAEFCGDA